MVKKIYQAICLVAALVLVCSTGLMTAVLYNRFSEQVQRELHVETVYIAYGLETQGESYLEGMKDQTRRITHIAADGTVLFDNAADSSAMENHLDREEVREALETGSGEGSRSSATLAENTFYYAKRLSDGTVLRMAATQRSVWALLLGVLQPVAMVILAVLILGAVLANRVANNIVAPINALDLEHPEQNEIYEEVSPLLSNIARLRRTIDRQLTQARRKQEEFRLITDHMSEGLLVIDSSANLLSCNGAALQLLGASEQPQVSSVLALNRSEQFRTAVREVLEGRHAEGQLTVGEQTLQLMANPVRQDEAVTGAVLLVVDVTERAQREQLRREFSANVSHELKTPLTSISGFAELLKSGVVAPEDVADFSKSIYEEAQRLIRLVEDIIRLSALDEGQLQAEMAPVDLYELAQEQIKRLQPQAEQRQVTLSLLGSRAAVQGSASVLEEMVYNLCDNAVKYNRPGGTVDVVITAGETVKLVVRDTGIGIPAASRSRVFERFYRVDKSHSKDVGGTGLGLSIVKHGAMLHGAKIDLDSVEGKGTTITVEFPAQSL